MIAHSATHITGRHQLAFCTGASQWWTETPDIHFAFCGGAFAIYDSLFVRIWCYKFWRFLAFCSGAFTLTTQQWTVTPDTPCAFCGGALADSVSTVSFWRYTHWQFLAFCSGAYTLVTDTSISLFSAVAYSVYHTTVRHHLAFCTGALQWLQTNRIIAWAFCSGAVHPLQAWSHWQHWQHRIQHSLCSGVHTLNLLTPFLTVFCGGTILHFLGFTQICDFWRDFSTILICLVVHYILSSKATFCGGVHTEHRNHAAIRLSFGLQQYSAFLVQILPPDPSFACGIVPLVSIGL